MVLPHSSGDLYHKYRPLRFNEVVGHKQAISSIKKAIHSDNPPQAFLLTGDSGCGKTTTARIMALSLNCVIMATLGGSGTIWGPVIGAIFLSVLIELLWIRIPHFHAIIFSLLVIVVVLKVPGGLTELIGKVLERSVGRNRVAHSFSHFDKKKGTQV